MKLLIIFAAVTPPVLLASILYYQDAEWLMNNLWILVGCSASSAFIVARGYLETQAE